MDFGLFLEFTAPEGTPDQETFTEGFSLVDAAESMGVDSVWLAEYHFSTFSVLSAPITVATAVAARTPANADRLRGRAAALEQPHQDRPKK